MNVYENIVDFVVVNEVEKLFKYNFRMPTKTIRFTDNWFCYDTLANKDNRRLHIEFTLQGECTEDFFLLIAAHLFCGLRSIERIVDEYL